MVYAHKERKYKAKLIALILIALIGWVLYFMMENMKPVVKTICASQARILSTSAMNSAVVAELYALDVEYSKLVDIMRDTSGNIIAIETNAVEVNKIKAILTDAVNEKLKTIPDQNVRIPFGTLTGIQFLSGKGPAIRLKMTPSSYVESALINKFDTAGINQTRHQIMIEFKVTMTAILAPYSTSVNVTTNICIAETVIIGTVPEMFADLSGDSLSDGLL
ncbi:MAG: sporulation protein YunB [Oscillospiraceae bacterium]